MRLVGLLASLAILAYAITMYLGSTPGSEEGASTPQQYSDEAKQSVDAINEAMKQQQQQLDNNK